MAPNKSFTGATSFSIFSASTVSAKIDPVSYTHLNVPFTEGDVVWVVGERDDVYRLLGKKEKEEE